MSKRQEKLKKNQEEAAAFVSARREIQYSIFENNFKTGLKLYEDNKDKMSEEEIALVEVEIAKNMVLLEKLKSEI